MVVKARHEMVAISKLRFLFKILLHHCRNRYIRHINTEDIVTTEVPKKPVYILDWASRASHVFEAATLMRDITERLMQHDGVFDTSSHPRNPFTNTPLTQAQIISVWNQISLSGVATSTAFSAFRQSRWNLLRFNREYSHMLKLHAFRKTMVDPTHPDYVDRMADFIHYAHSSEGEYCDITTYKYALIHSSRNRLLNQWSKLCTKFYEASILYREDSDQFIAVRDSVFDCASVLFDRVKELQNIPF